MNTIDKEYEDKLIEAFIDKPAETLWYQNAFKKFAMVDGDSMQWHWSWWAFGTGFLFLLYRKEYFASFALFIISLLMSFIPIIGGILSMVLAGGYSTYFIYKGYKTKLAVIESKYRDKEQRVKAIREVGGYNQWVVWVYIALTLIIGFYFVSLISTLLVTLPN